MDIILFRELCFDCIESLFELCILGLESLDLSRIGLHIACEILDCLDDWCDEVAIFDRLKHCLLELSHRYQTSRYSSSQKYIHSERGSYLENHEVVLYSA